MDNYRHEIARLFLEELGANYARIMDGTVEAIMPGGTMVRVSLEELR